MEEPSLGSSQEEEDEEMHKAKCTLRLLKVLAEVMPNNFSGSEICERLVVLLRHEDSSIGEGGKRDLDSGGGGALAISVDEAAMCVCACVFM